MFRRFLFLLGFVLFSAPSPSYAKDTESKVYELPAQYIAKHVEATKGQKRVLLIYASWCPSCVQKMPGIMNLERAKPGSVIAVSVDDDYQDFARYVRKMKNPPFKVIVSKDSEDSLARQIKKFGVQPWEYIPQMILLDEDNQLVEQGSMEVEDVAQFLFRDVKKGE